MNILNALLLGIVQGVTEFPDIRPIGGKDSRKGAQVEQYVEKYIIRALHAQAQQVLDDGEVAGGTTTRPSSSMCASTARPSGRARAAAKRRPSRPPPGTPWSG